MLWKISLLKHQSIVHTMSCSGDVFGAGGNSCFGGRTTVGMIRLWRAVSSSVASSRVYSDGFIGKRAQANVRVNSQSQYVNA